MDHYIPKRRIPVTLWASASQGVSAQLFLDLDPSGNRHQTVVEKLNESVRFLPVAIGEEGRVHLFNKARLLRVTVGRQVLPSDVFSRGFQPWREEETELLLADGLVLAGRVWMPMQRETQRLSDHINQQGGQFFVLLGGSGIHLVNTSLVVRMALQESAGSPLVPDGLEAPLPF